MVRGSNRGAAAHFLDNSLLGVAEGVCLEVGFREIEFVCFREPWGVAHEVGAVFACTVSGTQVLAALFHVDHAGFETAVAFRADK